MSSSTPLDGGLELKVLTPQPNLGMAADNGGHDSGQLRLNRPCTNLGTDERDDVETQPLFPTVMPGTITDDGSCLENGTIKTLDPSFLFTFRFYGTIVFLLLLSFLFIAIGFGLIIGFSYNESYLLRLINGTAGSRHFDTDILPGKEAFSFQASYFLWFWLCCVLSTIMHRFNLLSVIAGFFTFLVCRSDFSFYALDNIRKIKSDPGYSGILDNWFNGAIVCYVGVFLALYAAVLAHPRGRSLTRHQYTQLCISSIFSGIGCIVVFSSSEIQDTNLRESLFYASTGSFVVTFLMLFGMCFNRDILIHSTFTLSSAINTFYVMKTLLLVNSINGNSNSFYGLIMLWIAGLNIIWIAYLFQYQETRENGVIVTHSSNIVPVFKTNVKTVSISYSFTNKYAQILFWLMLFSVVIISVGFGLVINYSVQSTVKVFQDSTAVLQYEAVYPYFIFILSYVTVIYKRHGLMSIIAGLWMRFMATSSLKLLTVYSFSVLPDFTSSDRNCFVGLIFMYIGAGAAFICAISVHPKNLAVPKPMSLKNWREGWKFICFWVAIIGFAILGFTLVWANIDEQLIQFLFVVAQPVFVVLMFFTVGSFCRIANLYHSAFTLCAYYCIVNLSYLLSTLSGDNNLSLRVEIGIICLWILSAFLVLMCVLWNHLLQDTPLQITVLPSMRLKLMITMNDNPVISVNSGDVINAESGENRLMRLNGEKERAVRKERRAAQKKKKANQLKRKTTEPAGMSPAIRSALLQMLLAEKSQQNSLPLEDSDSLVDSNSDSDAALDDATLDDI